MKACERATFFKGTRKGYLFYQNGIPRVGPHQGGSSHKKKNFSRLPLPPPSPGLVVLGFVFDGVLTTSITRRFLIFRRERRNTQENVSKMDQRQTSNGKPFLIHGTKLTSQSHSQLTDAISYLYLNII